MPIRYQDTYLCDLSRAEFIASFKKWGVGSGTSKTIFKALYQQPLIELKKIFKDNQYLNVDMLSIDLGQYRKSDSEDSSQKLVLDLSKTESIEAVRMPIRNKSSQRVTACVSSQVGCVLDCSFCVTGTLGLKRNLKTWEIIEQILLMNQIYPENPVSNAVFMGMGEPFYNYDAVKKSIDILSDDMGLKIARKRITVSTAGVIPKILSWAKEGKTNLAVSLISALDHKRTQLMSINQKYPLADLLKSIELYTQLTDKKVLCEYILIKDLTDRQEDFEAIVKLLQSKKITLNLIPYNENETIAFKRPDKKSIVAFKNKLSEQGIHATIRWSYGSDVGAACGQLKAKQ